MLTDKYLIIEAKPEGNKYHFDIPKGQIFCIQTISILNGNATIGIEVDDDESDNEATKEILLGILNEKIPTHNLYIEIDINYVDFIVKGTGEVYICGYFVNNPNYIDFDMMDIVEEGFKLK